MAYCNSAAVAAALIVFHNFVEVVMKTIVVEKETEEIHNLAAVVIMAVVAMEVHNLVEVAVVVVVAAAMAVVRSSAGIAVAVAGIHNSVVAAIPVVVEMAEVHN